MVQLLCVDISGLERRHYEALYRAATRERQQRADRYRRNEDALRCVAADGLLRYALGTGKYTVETEAGGKPRITGWSDFHFNLSHSGDWVVLAWANAPVGVDVEQIRQDRDFRAVAKRFFSEEEQRALETADDPRRRFYELWTGKESWIKHTGTGLNCDLRAFSVLSAGRERHIYPIPLAEGYCLSLCTTEERYSLEKIAPAELIGR